MKRAGEGLEFLRHVKFPRRRRSNAWHRRRVRAAAREIVWRLGLGFGLVALVMPSSLAGIVATCVVALGLVRAAHDRWSGWDVSLRWTLGLLGLGLGVASISSRFDALARREGLEGSLVRREASAWREGDVVVFPTRLVPGERHFVRASAERVSLRVGAWNVDAARLGPALFVLDLPHGIGTETPRLFVDGEERAVVLDAASRPRPAQMCRGGNVARVLTDPPSRETWRYSDGWVREVSDDVVLACAIDFRGREAWATPRGVRLGERRLDVVAEHVVFVGEELVTVAGREVRRWGADGQVVARHTLDFAPVHVVADEGALFLARGRRLRRLVVSTALAPNDAATEAVSMELPGDVVALGVGPTLAVATNAVEAPGARVGNHYVEDAVLELDRVSLTPLAVHRTARRTRRQDHPGAVDSGLLPRALVWRDGWRVAFAGSGEIGELDGMERITRLPRALSTPTCLAILDDGTRLVVSAGAAGAWADGGWSLVGDHAIAGERAFYAPTRSGIACASCHVEGGEARHRLGPASDEARAAHVAPPIVNLRETPPYFRDGAYPTLDALVDEGVHLFGGHRDTSVDALVPWLHSRGRGASRAALPATREGWRAFSEEGCPRCHVAPAFTDGVMRTTGELGGAGAVLRDTPSLVGLRERSELGHDLRAPDVAAFLERAEGVHRVSPSRRRALRRFLEAL